MGEAIVITSGKGGVGKTTATANLGTALALAGKKVCLVDTDIGLRNLDVILGLENRIVYDLLDVAEGECRLQQALVKDKRFEALYLLPAAQTKDKTAIQPSQLKGIVDELNGEFDYVLIDCPAGIEHGFWTAVEGADHAIVVSVPEVASVRDADRVIGLLEAQKKISPRLVVNRYRPKMARQGDTMDLEEMIQVLSIDLLGVVPDDEMVIKASHHGEPTVMNPQSKAAIAFRNISRRIMGESVPLMKFEDDPGFFQRLRQMFRRR